MGGTDSSPAADAGSRLGPDPALAEGRSRIVLFVGMGGLGLGTVADMTAVVWSGVVLVAVAFALNTLGKLRHYWELPIAGGDSARLSLSWVLLASSVLGALLVFAYARYGPGRGDFFWPLAVAALGFSLLHMAVQGTFLPESDSTTGNGNGST